jgi:L-glyceraldehyde 3-phosphate reductase
MFDREIEATLIPTLAELGVGAIVYSPLAQGMLTDRYLHGTSPEGSRVVAGRYLSAETLDETFLARARALQDIAASRGQTLAQLALCWVLRHAEVSSALIGASSVRQLEDNIAALAGPPLTEEELVAIDEHAVHGTAG